MTKILICSDKYKGSLTSAKVNHAILSGIRLVSQSAICDKVNMSDGGDGFLSIIDNAKILKYKTVNALHRVIDAEVAYKDNTIYIELAKITGLVMLGNTPGTIWERSSYGLGKLISNILDDQIKVERIVIGCGGSSTNDGGYGCLMGLGAIFLNRKGEPLYPYTSEINHLAKIDLTTLNPRLKEITIDIIADVKGSLLSDNGCSMVFAAQKGASKQDIIKLDQVLTKFQQVLIKSHKIDINKCEYGLCSGGLPAGLSVLAKLNYHNGADWVIKQSNLELKIAYCDIVISGEGMVDATTMRGKLISQIAELCTRHQKPLIIIAGQINCDLDNLYSHGVTAAFPIINTISSNFSNSEYLICQRVSDLFRMSKLSLSE